MNSLTSTGENFVNNQNLSTDVETYLISNYKEALNRGDKGVAKSCLLAARYFSLNDQDVTNEIYLMAKADGDATEASKCFAKIFNDLFISNENDDLTYRIKTDSHSLVLDQMKEEIKSILIDLESKFLKLKSSATSSESSQSHNVTASNSPIAGQSAILTSPISRMRMMSVESRESISRLDNNISLSRQQSLNNSRNSFYQQLFDNLSDETKRSLLYHSIDYNENNTLEACRLMMLTISIYQDTVTIYGSRLLRSLINLSDPNKTNLTSSTNNNFSHDTCKYAKRLLVLDAIPLVLNNISLTNLELDVEELFERTLNFYSEHYLEAFAREYRVNELHEGMKKSIAARILGIENNRPVSEELREDYLIGTLRFLSEKFMETINDTSVKTKFMELRSLISDNKNTDLFDKFDKINTIIENLDLDIDLPDDILFNNISKQDATSNNGSQQSLQIITPPPKTRGRPKKSQQQQSVIISLDDGVKRHLHNKSHEIHFIFHLIVEYMFLNCSRYLKNTKSRILFNFDNPLLVNTIENEINNKTTTTSNTTQRSSRSSKNVVNSQTLSNPEQQSSSTTSINSTICLSPNKRIKLDAKISKLLSLRSDSHTESPLNSEQSRKLDRQMLTTLNQSQKCFDYLQDSKHVIFNKLWNHFNKSNQIDNLNWFKKIQIDSLLLSEKYEKVLEILDCETLKFSDDIAKSSSLLDDNIVVVQQTAEKQPESQSCSITTMSNCFESSNISIIRYLVQSISCNVQLSDRIKTLEKINNLLNRMKHCGLLANNICPYENILDEYMIHVKHNNIKYLGFLLFDSISLIRYCVNILTSIFKRYLFNSSIVNDSIIGHAIVLSQFDWPKELTLYNYCIKWIRINKPKSVTPQTLSASTKFTYTEFFTYVKNPNIIEDFMAMLNQGYTLDIKGPINNSATGGTSGASQNQTVGSGSTTTTRGNTGSSTRSSKMITTRGVNKTFKEDLKVALVSQMKNSSILIPLDLIVDFVQDSLIPYMNSQ